RTFLHWRGMLCDPPNFSIRHALIWFPGRPVVAFSAGGDGGREPSDICPHPMGGNLPPSRHFEPVTPNVVSIMYEFRTLAAPSSAHLFLVREMLEATTSASSKRKTKIQVRTPMR